jgi:hypothetical protein
MSRCRSCGATITWAATERGHRMPLEPDPAGGWLVRYGLAVMITGTVAPGEQETRYIPHFAGCPDANQWRRR